MCPYWLKVLISLLHFFWMVFCTYISNNKPLFFWWSFLKTNTSSKTAVFLSVLIYWIHYPWTSAATHFHNSAIIDDRTQGLLGQFSFQNVLKEPRLKLVCNTTALWQFHSHSSSEYFNPLIVCLSLCLSSSVFLSAFLPPLVLDSSRLLFINLKPFNYTLAPICYHGAKPIFS